MKSYIESYIGGIKAQTVAIRELQGEKGLFSFITSGFIESYQIK